MGVYELGSEKRYLQAAGAAEGCGGLVLPLDELWAEVEALEAAAAPA